jgi:CBS domain-containing protein
MTVNDRGPRAEWRDLGRFLAGVRPFDSLDPQQLAAIAAAATVREFTAGDLVVDAFIEPPAEIFVILEGEVDLWHDPDRVKEVADDRSAAGSVIGFSAVLTDRPVGPRVVAGTAARIAVLPGTLVEPAFYSRSGARFLAEYISHARTLAAEPPVFSTVEDLIAHPPLVVDPTTTVTDIARKLSERNMSCAVIPLSDGTFGTVTDSVLRRRVVADRLPPDTPAHTVMDHPATTITLAESAAEALITLLDTSAEYLLVVDRSGVLHGVVDARDFVLAPTTAGVWLLEQIRRARTRSELIQRARRTPEMLSDVISRGLATDRVVNVYSAIVDSIVRQSIDQVFAEQDDLPTDGFTWLSLGSNGRREAVPCSDVDAAVAFDDHVSAETMTRYRAAFEQVGALLTEAGLNIDAHGAFPSNAPFSRTNTQWREAATRWLTAPSENKGPTMAVLSKGLAVMTSLLVDARPIHGNPGLPAVARVFGDFRQHPATMDLLLAESLSYRAKVRERSIRDVLTGKGDAFNVKSYGLLPVVNIARWAALGVGSTELQTVKRLREAAGSDILPIRQADRLIEVFDVLQRMRLRHQLNQIARGEKPTDVIDRDELSPIERTMITQSVREINAIQRRMDRIALSRPPRSWAARHPLPGRRKGT